MADRLAPMCQCVRHVLFAFFFFFLALLNFCLLCSGVFSFGQFLFELLKKKKNNTTDPLKSPYLTLVLLLLFEQHTFTQHLQLIFAN